MLLVPAHDSGDRFCLTVFSCSAVWQHPFVDVFRYCNLKQWPQGNFTKEGNVKVAMVRDRIPSILAMMLTQRRPACHAYRPLINIQSVSFRLLRIRHYPDQLNAVSGSIHWPSSSHTSRSCASCQLLAAASGQKQQPCLNRKVSVLAGICNVD